ncbi:hypothetical protein [Streptomyces uncialis]|uniref:imine reductase family protein n=1 Tax=Streptomyces uncialis TaxID=1048205 RepID=UPI00386BDA2E
MYATGQGLTHAQAMVGTAGVSATEFQPHAADVFHTVLAGLFDAESARVVDEADYATEVSNISTNQLAVGHIHPHQPRTRPPHRLARARPSRARPRGPGGTRGRQPGPPDRVRPPGLPIVHRRCGCLLSVASHGSCLRSARRRAPHRSCPSPPVGTVIRVPVPPCGPDAGQALHCQGCCPRGGRLSGRTVRGSAGAAARGHPCRSRTRVRLAGGGAGC